MKKILILAILLLGSLFVIDKNSYAATSCIQCGSFGACKDIGGGYWAKAAKCISPSNGDTCYISCSAPVPTKEPRDTPVPTAKPTSQVKPTATPKPTVATGPGTPTPTPKTTAEAWNIAPVTPGTVDLCQSLTISDTSLGSGETITFTSKSISSDIVSFGWWFYNLDNSNKPIKFVTGNNVAGVTRNTTVATNALSLNVDFADMNRKDLNWNSYMSRPKRIRVEAYFKKAGSNAWSKQDNACVKTFTAATVDPTPTINPKCGCSSNNTCTKECFFDKYGSGINYPASIQCNAAGNYSSTPSDVNKNKWCQAYYRTKGDANGDGKADLLDYFYYISVSFGGRLHPTVNADFNGDGVISSADRAILIKTLKP